MAKITLDIPDGIMAKVADMVAARNGYREQVSDPNNPSATIPNPMSKAEFVKRVLIRFLKAEVRLGEHQEAIRKAQEQAAAVPDPDIT